MREKGLDLFISSFTPTQSWFCLQRTSPQFYRFKT